MEFDNVKRAFTQKLPAVAEFGLLCVNVIFVIQFDVQTATIVPACVCALMTVSGYSAMGRGGVVPPPPIFS